MPEATVLHEKEIDGGWEFLVSIGDSQYTVTVGIDYWQKLTKGAVSPAELVKRSFAFLLKREPKEAILPSFDLSVIATYFPE